MPEQLQRIINRIIEWWKKFTTKQKVVIISAASVVIIALIILIIVVSRPETMTLISCDSAEQSKTVQDLLDGESITYTTDDSGLIITINKEDEARANILLGTNDIKSDGYDISDVIDGSFSTTEADKEKKYKLYLEERFAEHLSALNTVESAEVTLNLPSNDGTLSSQKEEAYANVILHLKGKDGMDDDTAAGIAEYVATGLGNKTTDNILILDSDGNVLFSGGQEASTSGLASSNLSVQEKAKAKIANEVKKVVLGTDVYDNVDVGVNLVMDFNATKTTDYHYYVDDGQEQGYLDSETVSESESSSGTGGIPGTDSNNNDDTTYVLEDNNNSKSTTSERTTDYLPSETITETTNAGGIVDYENSSLTVVCTSYVIYNEDKLKKDGSLDDMTFDEFVSQNSDRVKTDVDEDFVNMVANATGFSVDKITVVAYEIPMFQYSEGSGLNITDIVQIILAILIFALLVFVVLRTLRRNNEEEEAEEVSIESLIAEQEEELADIGFNDKSEARLLIEKFVDEKPEAVATLLRNWLNEDWS